MILDKWDHRVFDVINLLIEFGKESNVNLYTGSRSQEEKMLNDLWRIFNDPEADILISYTNGKPAGFAIVYYDTMFTDEAGLGIVGKFYVHPEHRGSGIGRELCEDVCNWFDKIGAIDSYVTSTAGIGQNKQFENLFAKYGFEQVGICMKRTQHE